LVADDFGRLGRAWREADYEATDLETVIQDLLTGQYSPPDPRRRVQYRRALVGRCFRRRRPRIAQALRSTDARAPRYDF
jgi:hypothetical protein